jgi:ATP-binding cassette subfamily B protein
MERGAQDERLARHLFLLGTTAPPAKEVRVARAEQRIRGDRRAAWDRARLPVAGARWATAAWMAGCWALFGAAFSGCLAFVALANDASPGDVLLVLVAGTRLSQYVGLSITEVSFLRGFWLDAARRLAWLEDYAAASALHADMPVPERLEQGIRFEGVSFTYPGTDRVVLDAVDLMLPAGSVVAVVGENGAGKSTLVKLLCRFYEPSTGQLLVDGVALARMPADEWRRRLTGSFQDFFRFELLARHSIGLGDLDHLDDEPAVSTAVVRGGATDVLERLPHGLATQLGPTWADGVELSHGQWQKLALARGFMPDDTLLLVLDEPTSALDAETEHALFERYAAAARDGAERNGRITVLVSHRFSTVRMADLIVVVDGARIVECGSHADLLAAGGRYAELYTIQASAYR